MIRLLLFFASCLLANHALAFDCLPTPQRTTGTHYAPVTQQKTDVSKGLLVRGQVLSYPECTPVRNAKIAHWQAGENGRYQDRLRAFLFSDQDGYFLFETEWPDMPSPHIHFIVTADGFKKLETQWIGQHRTNKIEFNMVISREDD